MHRREFVAVLGGAISAWPLMASGQSSPPTSAVRQDWLDRHKEAILEPELPIVDPHHHLWIRPGWRYMADDLLADINSGHNIVATVFVQAHSMYRAGGPIEMRPIGETEFVNGIAAMFASGVVGKTRACAGIVGQADLTLGSRVEPVLTAHLRAGGDRFRGIRHITSWDPDASIRNPDYPAPPGLLKDRTFREGVAKLVQFGLSFDAMVYHPQIDDVADLAGAFPGLKIVLNHAGVPLGINAYRGKRDEVFATWSASLKALARHDNVYIKIGGLGQRYTGLNFNERAEPPSSDGRGAGLPPLCRDVHRGVRACPVHVREQFPGRQALLQLPGILECLQADDKRRQPIRKSRTLRRNGHEVLSAQWNWLKELHGYRIPIDFTRCRYSPAPASVRTRS